MSQKTLNTNERIELCDADGPIPTFAPRTLDEHGRLIPLSPEEQKTRSEAALRALKAIEQINDESDSDDELWREAFRDLDAQRPHRPLFEGMY